jgi:CHAD domain-containing protein
VPDPAIDAAVRATTRAWCDAVRSARKRPDSRRRIHDFRIATRQLLAVEELLAPARSPQQAQVASRLAPAFRAAGKLRDAQLCSDRLRAMREAHPVAAQVDRDLRERLPRRTGRFAAALAELDVDRCKRDLRKLRAGASRPVAARRLRSRRAELRAGLDALPTAPTLTQIHRLRLLVKRVRYMQEWLTALNGRAPTATQQQELADLQDRMGEIADARALQRAIRRWQPRSIVDRAGHRRLLRSVRPPARRLSPGLKSKPAAGSLRS